MFRFHPPSLSSSGGSGVRTPAACRSSVVPHARRPGPAGLHLNQWVEDADANRRLIVEVIGDIDAATAPRLLSALTRIIGQGTSVCCDLSAVDFFGADGAHVLAVAHLRTAGAHGQFSVRGVLGLTARILESTGLDEILTIVD